MPGIKELKTRIKSIGSTRKITRAMQMVSAAKMRKAQIAALSSRTYSNLAWALIHSITTNIESLNPLLKSYPQATKTGVIIISSNKGLVGGFNANLMHTARPLLDNDQIIAELLVMGRKAKDYAVRFNKNLKADFPKSDVWVGIDSIYPLAKMVSDFYQTGQYKSISIVYNQFISTLIQKATIKHLLPFAEEAKGTLDPYEASYEPHIEEADTDSVLFDLKMNGGDTLNSSFLFEPSPDFVLNHLLPRIIESQIYQALLESDASEHSARMVMMKNATEAAGDIIDDLTLTYNGMRQSKITTELSEITAGRIALE